MEANVADEVLGTKSKVKGDDERLGFKEGDADRLFANNPILNAKKNGANLMEAQSMNLAQWRLMCWAAMLLLTLSVVGNIYLSTSVKVQPYVVQVDSHGYAIPIEHADVSNIDYRVVAAQIGQFIFNSRVRVMDRAAQVYFATTSYKSVSNQSQAQQNLDAYFRANVPTTAKDPVDVELKSVIPITEATYHAEWIERSGKSEHHYQGVYEVVISPPSDVANLVNNPLGVYITDFRVQEKLN